MIQGETEVSIPPVPEVVVKRGRGRPRKVVEQTDEVVEPKKKGRPRTLPVREPLPPQKRGPKTDASLDKSYFTNYYKEHYHGVKVACKFCHNPDIPIDKQLRHARSRKCMIDEFFGKYKKPETENV